jgi:hypothetical protein
MSLNIARRIVIEFAWGEFGDNTVNDVSIVVHHQNILDPNIFIVVQQRLAQVTDDLVQVAIAMQTLDPERDPGHDRLFLLNDHACIGANRAEVEVILHTKGQPQHQRQ